MYDSTPMPRTRLFWTIILGLAAVNVAIYWGYIVDDAYISFRYVHNWLGGEGLVFNPGERLESYSNFLWILLLSPCGAADIPLPLAARGLGALFFGATIILGKGIADVVHREGSSTVNFCAPLLIATSPHLGFWATGGLETMAFAALLCAAACLALKASFSAAEQVLFPLTCLALTLCRPEGVAIAAGCYAYALALRRQRRVWLSAAVFGTLVLSLLALRHAYYGELLPHTFYAKAQDLLAPLKGASTYSYGALSSVGGLAALVCPLLVVIRRRGERGLWLLLGLLLFYVAFQFRFGWDWMPFFRFFTPYLPILLVLYTLFVADFVRGVAARALVVLGVVLWMNAWSVQYTKDGISAFDDPEAEGHPYYQIAQDLEGLTQPADYVLYEEMGLIPFYTRARFLDAIGLTDKHIGQALYAHRAGGADGIDTYFPAVLDYVRDKRPEVIILPSPLPVDNPLFGDTLKRSWPYPLYHAAWFETSYRYLKSRGNYHLFVRRDGPATLRAGTTGGRGRRR